MIGKKSINVKKIMKMIKKVPYYLDRAFDPIRYLSVSPKTLRKRREKSETWVIINKTLDKS